MSKLALSILSARETQYIEVLQNGIFMTIKNAFGYQGHSASDGRVKLSELSVLWITFLAVCGASAIFFLVDQKRGFDALRRPATEYTFDGTVPLDNIKTEVAGTDTDTDKFEIQNPVYGKSTEVELSEDVRKGDSAASEFITPRKKDWKKRN